MSSKQEESTQIAGQTFPLNDARPTRRPLNKWLGMTVALILVAAVFISGVWSRVSARRTLTPETPQVALTALSVLAPKDTEPAEEIILPGNVQPFITSPIYARPTGYLR